MPGSIRIAGGEGSQPIPVGPFVDQIGLAPRGEGSPSVVVGDAVGAELAAIHAIHFDEDFAPHPMYASLTRDQFQAFWNFMCIYEDASAGIHNPDYTEQMLSKAETYLDL